MRIDPSTIKMKNKLKTLIMYSYIRHGVIFKVRNMTYRFIGFAYDRIDNEDVVIHILCNVKSGEYIAKREKDYENETAYILKEQ